VESLRIHQASVAYSRANRAIVRYTDQQVEILDSVVMKALPFYADLLLLSNYIPVNALMYEKRCLDEVGGFDESLPVFEDWDVLIRLSRKWSFVWVPIITCEVRWKTDGTNMSVQHQKKFLTTQEHLYKKYQDLVKDREDLRAEQDKQLEERRRKLVGTKPT
jgi:hypothetical protein